MIVGLFVLTLSAMAMVSMVSSAAVWALWPFARGVLQRLTPAAEWRALFTLSCLPLFAGLLVVAACFLPSVFATTDHCLHHGLHHPHLCLRHLPYVVPTLAVWAIAGFIVARVGRGLSRAARGLLRSMSMTRALSAAAVPRADGIRVLPGTRPEAFVLGLLRPVLFASSGLLSMPEDVQGVVLAHERAHIERRDPLRQLVATAVLGFHLPGIAEILRLRLLAAAEMAADAQAAEVCCDGPRVAEVLVHLTRARHAYPEPVMGFAGNLEVRVRRLLGPRGHGGLSPAAVGGIVATIVVSAMVLAEPLHHAVETFLGIMG